MTPAQFSAAIALLAPHRFGLAPPTILRVEAGEPIPDSVRVEIVRALERRASAIADLLDSMGERKLF